MVQSQLHCGSKQSLGPLLSNSKEVEPVVSKQILHAVTLSLKLLKIHLYVHIDIFLCKGVQLSPLDNSHKKMFEVTQWLLS